MGEIRRQSVKGSIYLYLGVGIGFITTGIFWPKILTTTQIGLFNALIAYSLIFAQFASLGFNNVTTRLFPYFRTNSNQHNGFLFLAFLVNLAGLIICIIVFFIIKPNIVKGNLDNLLFAEYCNYIIPLLIFTSIFSLFDTYTKMLFDTVIGIFLKEFVFRVLNLILIILFYFNLLTFENLALGYIFINCLPTVLLFIILLYRRQINFTPALSFIDKNLKSSIINVALFGIIGGFSAMAISTIDKIMLKEMIGLKSLGIYSTAILFGTIISIPSRSIVKISTTFIAEAWKSNDLKKVDEIYYKTCINQLIFGSLIFINLWGNIHNVFNILGDEYRIGFYVILFFGFSNLFDMATGANGVIIQTSKYFKVQTLFIVILMILVVTTNLIFIPKFGITGAAFASALSNFIFNLLRYLFIYYKFKLQPFNYKFLISIAISVSCLLLVQLIPYQNSLFQNLGINAEIKKYLGIIFDTGIRCLFITIIFVALTLTLKLSDDLNDRFKVYLKLIKSKIKFNN